MGGVHGWKRMIPGREGARFRDHCREYTYTYAKTTSSGTCLNRARTGSTAKKPRELDKLSINSFDFSFHTASLFLFHLVAKVLSIIQSKESTVIRLQATLNVQHQAIHTLHFCRGHHGVQTSKQSNKSRPPMSWYRHPVKLFAMIHCSTVPQSDRCSIQHFL